VTRAAARAGAGGRWGGVVGEREIDGGWGWTRGGR